MIDVLWLAIRLAIGGVLLVSAIAKVRAPSTFAADVARYRLLPAALIGLAAGAVIVAEFAAAGLLLTGSVAGCWLAAALFGGFGIAVGSALRRGLAIPCGCFGGSDPVSRVALVRLALLLGASVGGLLLAGAEPAQLVSGWALPMAATIALGGLMLGQLGLMVPDIRAAVFGAGAGAGAKVLGDEKGPA